ncbi:hypothetical protein NXV95_03665 [Bacteroides fragilis]|nr:hypothetical protein [Bacteroides fragilis]
METNDIKETWKAGIERTIKPYPEERLNEMVVNSARKSIKTVYPGTVFRLVIIAVAVFLIVSQFVKEQNATRMYLDMGALAVLSVSYFLWERSAYKMRKYTHGMPVKEWLEYRIKEIEKSIRFNTKYDWIVYTCSFLSAIGFYVFYLMATNVVPWHTERHCYSARHVHLPSDHQTLSETELPENPARAERTVQTI